VAFGLRAVWVLAFARVPSGLSDPILYHGYALRISTGQGYRSLAGDLTAYYPPGYPYFLGGLYELVDVLGLGDRLPEAVGLAQALLWAVTAVAVALTAQWALEDRHGPAAGRVGLAAGLVVACWPNLVVYAGAWLSESLFVCLFAVGVAALTRLAVARPAGWAAAGPLAVAAVALGAATMVRPQVLLGLPLVAVAWLVGGMGWRRTAALGGALAVGLAVFVVPWAVRNEGVFGEPVLVSTNGGDNLCVGFHPGANGSFGIPAYCDTGEFWNDGREAELRRDAETRDLALDHIVDEPLSLPWLSVRKLWYTYKHDGDGLSGAESYGADQILGSPWRGLFSVVSHVAYAVIMVASLVGAVVAAREAVPRRDPAVLGLLGLTLAGALVPVLFFGDARFKVPSTPLFAVWAGLALALGASHLAARRAR
jgi:hypothetical protein